MSGKAVIGGALIGLVLSVGVMYFALPFLYPVHCVVQVRTATFNSNAYILDTMKSSWVEMNDTELDITTRGNSQLSVSFQANMVMLLNPSFVGRFSINLSLAVIGVGCWNTTFIYVSNDPFSGTQYLEVNDNTNINYMTGTLNAGTYHIVVYWISTSSTSSGSNFLSACHDGYNRTRSLTAIEYAN